MSHGVARHGFVLIEVLYAIFLVLTAALIVAATMPVATVSRTMTSYEDKAMDLAQKQMEAIRTAGFANCTPGQLASLGVIIPPTRLGTTRTSTRSQTATALTGQPVAGASQRSGDGGTRHAQPEHDAGFDHGDVVGPWEVAHLPDWVFGGEPVRRYPRRLRGVTLIEAVLASVITAVALATALGTYMIGMMAWYRGEGNITAESGFHAAVTIISNELRQAEGVVVDPNGMGLTYELPAMDDTGTMIAPMQADGIQRRIELDGTTLNMWVNGAQRTLCTNVVLTDPNASGGGYYQIFTPGSGSTVRQVTVMVVTQAGSYGSETVTSRNRETIFLRKCSADESLEMRNKAS